jgi:NAD(P)-dependent dehydrogenase (short-subunit alcohol dehydrogenase family)
VRRVCLLTGASGPLGSAFIERYAERYEIAAVHHRRPVYFATQEQQFVDPLAPEKVQAANKRRVHAIRADIAQRESVETVVREVLDVFGQVDLLINSAAVRRFAPLTSAGEPDADAMFAVNVLAPLWFAIALARESWSGQAETNLRANRNVLNVSSTAGLFVYPDLGQGLYSCTKAALNQLTYHLASEFWDLGVRVNALAPDTFPGRISTEKVLEAMIAFDESAQTGEVTALYS